MARNWQDIFQDGQGFSKRTISQLAGIEVDLATALAYVSGGSQTYVQPSGSDDAAAIQAVAAATQDVGLRVGTYLAASGISISQQAIVEGRGGGSMNETGPGYWGDGLTTISVSSATANGFEMTAAGSLVDKFGVKCTNAAPTAGAGFTFGPHTHGFTARDISSHGFYDGIHVTTSNAWILDSFRVSSPTRYGLYIEGDDEGQAEISNGFIFANQVNAVSGIRWEGGGGAKFNNIKVNNTRAAKSFTQAVDIHAVSGTSTGEISFGDCVFDWGSTYGVAVNVDSGGFISELRFADCSIKGSGVLGTGYYVRSAGTAIQGFSVKGGLVKMAPGSSTGTGPAFDIDNVEGVNIDAVDIIGVAAGQPIVKLGSSVKSAVVRLGTIRPTAGSRNWTAGSSVILLEMDGGGFNVATGGIQSSQSHFTASMPSQNIAKGGYTSIWSVDVNSGAAVIVKLTAVYQTGGVYRIVQQTRSLRRTGSGTGSTATVGTDFADPATEVDIQWSVSGSTVTIGAQINAASAATSLTGYSTIEVIGLPKTITAIAGAGG